MKYVAASLALLGVLLPTPGEGGWQPGFSGPGTNNSVEVIGTFASDLVIGGKFTIVNDIKATKIARFDGEYWHPLGSGIGEEDGPWAEEVNCLAEFQGRLIAGGNFSLAGGQPASNIAQWDGVEWSAVGEGLAGVLRGICVHGDHLYAWGSNLMENGDQMSHIAIWDGQEWMPVPTEDIGPVLDFGFLDGEKVVLRSGDFQGDPIPSAVVRRRNCLWQPVGNLPRGDALEIFQGKIHVVLEEGGAFRWDVDDWTELPSSWWAIHIHCFTVFQGQLVLFGYHPWACQYDSSYYISHVWDGNSWEEWSLVPEDWGRVTSIAEWAGSIYFGGYFSFVEDVPSANLVSLTGNSWSPVGPFGGGFAGRVKCLSLFGDRIAVGGGSRLFVYDGDQWIPQLPGGCGVSIYWCHLDAGGVDWAGVTLNWPWCRFEFFANGGHRSFAGMSGDNGKSALSVLLLGNSYYLGLGTCADPYYDGLAAIWDGDDYVSHIPDSPAGSGVLSIVEFEDRIVFGGGFDTAGGQQVSNIAAWDGAQWEGLGEGVEFRVNALAVFEGQLVAAGTSEGAGPVAAWDGSSWCSIWDDYGYQIVYSLAVHDDLLIAGGSFWEVGSVPASKIAAWDGNAWHPLGAGVDKTVWALVSDGENLWAAGEFGSAGGIPSSHIACWTGPIVSNYLTAFEAERSGGGADIFWEVHSPHPDNVFRLLRQEAGEIPRLIGPGWRCDAVRFQFFDSEVPRGTVDYTLEEMDADGRVERLGTTSLDPLPLIQNDLFLAQNFPNPFNPQTTIAFSIDQDQPVEIAVFDMTGRRVAVLTSQDYQAGSHSVEWDGMNASGRAVASGTYLVRMTTPRKVESRKISLVR